jgi:hypothetical protein
VNQQVLERNCETHKSWHWAPSIYASTVVTACVLIFALPFCLPPSTPVRSASYVYGFNNSLCVCAVLLSVGLFYCVGTRLSAVSPTWLLSAFSFNASAPGAKVQRWAIWLCGLLTALSTLYIFLRTGSAGDYGESEYFLRRILLVLKGRVPYADFEFAYGPALVCLPASLHQLLAPLEISVKASYYLFYLIASWTGIVILAHVINCLGMGGKEKTILFLVCSILAWNESMGLNYILLRYVLPMAFLLLLHQRLVPLLGWMRYHWLISQGVLAGASAGCVLLCLAVSPEMGLAFFVAISIYWAYLAWTVSPRYVLALLANAGCLALVALNWFDYFDTVMAFGAGGFNFPVIPSISILLYLFTVLYSVPLAAGVVLGSRRHFEAAILAAWAALTVALIPGALGRCDGGHTFFYGLPALMLTWVALRGQSNKIHMAFVIVVAASFLILKISYFNFVYTGLVPYKVSAFIERFLRPDEPGPPAEPGLAPSYPSAPPHCEQSFSALTRFGKLRAYPKNPAVR